MGIFRDLRAAWALRHRMNDLEDRCDSIEHLVQRLTGAIRNLEQECERLDNNLAKWRGHITGGKRKNDEPALQEGLPFTGQRVMTRRGGR